MAYLSTKSHAAWKERIDFEGYLTRLHSNDYAKTFYNSKGTRIQPDNGVHRTACKSRDALSLAGGSTERSARRGLSSSHRRNCFKNPQLRCQDPLKRHRTFDFSSEKLTPAKVTSKVKVEASVREVRKACRHGQRAAFGRDEEGDYPEPRVMAGVRSRMMSEKELEELNAKIRPKSCSRSSLSARSGASHRCVMR
eukprot:TRINITY_DN5831_c0_g1_i1.p1 TRINITY_DN5831_c0_g1~~TRINITY_DN5831_c0_g1_i1.p1  ORF type:complete len:195 (-),score=15.56 TRINITY_DN5831_c0_g1_i1:304-888(-)